MCNRFAYVALSVCLYSMMIAAGLAVFKGKNRLSKNPSPECFSINI